MVKDKHADNYIYQKKKIFTDGKVWNVSRLSILQKSCKLMTETMMRELMVNKIRVPSFTKGPKI